MYDYVYWIISGVFIILNIIQLIANRKSKKQNEIRELRKENSDLFEKNKLFRKQYDELEKQYNKLKKQHEYSLQNIPEERDEYSEAIDELIKF